MGQGKSTHHCVLHSPYPYSENIASASYNVFSKCTSEWGHPLRIIRFALHLVRNLKIEVKKSGNEINVMLAKVLFHYVTLHMKTAYDSAWASSGGWAPQTISLLGKIFEIDNENLGFLRKQPPPCESAV
jgi:hypothetical protein